MLCSKVDDLPGAAHHLGTPKERADGSSRWRKHSLWLHLGDVEAARRSLDPGASTAKVVEALCDMAEGEYGSALIRWRELRETSGSEMIGVNMAVCLLYVGKMQEGKEILETMVDSGLSSHTLLFNLTTMDELCTERSRNLKLGLAEKVAALDEIPHRLGEVERGFQAVIQAKSG